MSEGLDLVDAFSGAEVTRNNDNIYAVFSKTDSAYGVFRAIKPDVPSDYPERHRSDRKILLTFEFEQLRAASMHNQQLAPVVELLERMTQPAGAALEA